jgi:hypothetical protein
MLCLSKLQMLRRLCVVAVCRVRKSLTKKIPKQACSLVLLRVRLTTVTSIR